MIKSILISGWIIFFIMLFVGSYGVLHYEQQIANPTIVNYEDALWWSINVSSAVGDCALSPKTTGGRVVSTIMMIFGYALFSLNIGIIAAFFRKEINEKITKPHNKK